mmetsp:Transcript_10371/g.28647  ORF Transcript_10371/g.28647 Transcript_10371/m.28647 type:complete len:499 (-) Transcript_10371:14-1510(-)
MTDTKEEGEDDDNTNVDTLSIQQLLRLDKKQSHPELFSSTSSPPPYTFVTKLDLFGCGLSRFPDGFETALPNLSILFCAQNNFVELPAVMGACPRLQMVAFRHNQIAHIPPDALSPQLRWLILTGNRLATLPETMGDRCPNLQKCMLAGNRLAGPLPESLQRCRALELIRLSSNRLTAPPVVLWKYLPRLAWAAVADNPFLNHSAALAVNPTTTTTTDGGDSSSSSTTTTTSLPTLDITISEDDPILGQGAGGVTRKVLYQGQYVALKEYGGAMTSDGLPESERHWATVASQLQCDAVVQVLGQTATSGALVMEYLDGYTALAGPPSLQSCSRDVYDETVDRIVMTTADAHVLISKLLQTLSRLHAAGICHGDLYGHNILVRPHQPSQVRLTDWGAAFGYDVHDARYAPYVRWMELRALAVLVEEVQEHFLTHKNREPSPLLERFINYLREELAAAHASVMEEKDGDDAVYNLSFETVLVWWKQQQLSDMARQFQVDE